MYAVVDLETTGGKANQDRIIEIGIVKHDGTQIVDRYSTLINPEIPLPPYITHLTGIRADMLRNAPKFYEVAKEVVQFTEGCIFVAHNVRFDYSFLKREFYALGYHYTRKRLCTVRMSKELVPGFTKYNLGDMCRRLGIDIRNHHRALDDAQATAELLTHLLQIVGTSKEAEAFLKKELKEGMLPPYLNENVIVEMPETPGVYTMYDEHGNPLYVGKAKRLQDRVWQHFIPDHQSNKGIEFKNSVRDITVTETGSELIANLLESQQIKALSPQYNKALRAKSRAYGINSDLDANGYLRLKLGTYSEKSEVYLTANSHPQAKSTLVGLVKRYSLCPKLCGLEKYEGACTSYQMGDCHGACDNKEEPDNYNQRVANLLEAMQLKSKNQLIWDSGRTPTERSFLMILGSRVYGYGFVDDEEPSPTLQELKDRATKLAHYPDSVRYINSYLEKNKKTRELKVKAIRAEEAIALD